MVFSTSKKINSSYPAVFPTLQQAFITPAVGPEAFEDKISDLENRAAVAEISMPLENDEEKIRLFLSLYKDAYRRMYLFTKTLLPMNNEVDDILQDVSLLLWKKFSSFRPGDAVHSRRLDGVSA